jgi:hypothetical protein
LSVPACCHAVIVNTLNRLFRLSGITRLHALMGGFHLINAGDMFSFHTTFANVTVSDDSGESVPETAASYDPHLPLYPGYMSNPNTPFFY